MRLLIACGVGIGAIALTATPAAADPARPTNVSSHVTAITPPTPTVSADIVGGNAFVRIHVRPGTTVVVHGYEDEPYLRIAADGTVAENTRSAATYLNRTLTGRVDIPATVDKDAPPEWHTVATGGTYAWHDHRVHWMASGNPPEAVDWHVPLQVDGAPVSIDGRYEGVGAPSAVRGGCSPPSPSGSSCCSAGRIRAASPSPCSLRRPSGFRWRWQSRGYLQAASATGPVSPSSAWPSAPPLAPLSRAPGAWLAGAGVALLVWSVRRLDVFDHAVLVTDLPDWLDRAAVALALGVGAGAVVIGVRLVVRAPIRQPA